MLHPDRRYVSLDFETTGLDSQIDSIIQIGLVEIDCSGNILRRYQSLVRPERMPDQLRDIVYYITGVSLADLQQAPLLSEILTDVRDFFGEDVVLIGHNIDFDVRFLVQHMPELVYAGVIDTMPLAQACIHFAPSYALEVLVSFMTKDELFATWLKLLHDDVTDLQFHDALHDAIHALVLFLYCLSYIHSLIQDYRFLGGVYKKIHDNSFFSHILWLNIDDIAQAIDISPLQKYVSAGASLQKNIDTFPLQEYRNNLTLGVADMSFEECMKRLCSHKNVVMSFSHKQKLDIAKRFLQEQSVQGIGYLSGEQRIDLSRLKQFFSKPKFLYEEFLFCCKYLSHMRRGIGFLDLQSVYDYRIYYFIRDDKQDIVSQSLVLTTHGGLLSYIKKNPDALKDYTICFMDSDWWYMSYNQYMAEYFDPYDFLQFMDKLVYTYDLCVQIWGEGRYGDKYQLLQGFYTFLTIFFGILFIETKHFFTHTQSIVVQLDPIIEHPQFYKSSLLWSALQTWQDRLQVALPSAVYADIALRIDKMHTVLESVVSVRKSMYQQSSFYFVYTVATVFVQRQEFVQSFSSQKILFFSSYEKKNSLAISCVYPVVQPSITLQEDKNLLLKQLREFSTSTRIIFIVCTQKDLSKDLFSLLFNDPDFSQYAIIVENITGGYGKSLYQAMNKESCIIIGGYNFLLACYSKYIPIDNIFIFHILGRSRSLILSDLFWYGSKIPQT